MTAEERKAEEKRKEDERKKYFDSLAKPTFKFEKLRQLITLRKMFPADRVIQRMIEEEKEANPDYPEDLMKGAPAKPVVDKRAAAERVAKFESEMQMEARAFIEQAKKKRTDEETDNVVVVKQTLSDLYVKMRRKYHDVILSSYNMDNGAEFSLDSKTLTVSQQPFPEKFKRLFFKKLREESKKEPKLAGTKYGVRNVRRKVNRMFMTSGGHKCALHPVSCPVYPCKYGTLNKKIALTFTKTRKNVKEKLVSKTLAFGKRELYETLSKIFMTNDEAANCQFIPKISEKSREIMKKGQPEEEGKKPATFEEKFGANFTKSDPTIYKKGILKKAWRLYHEGQYMKADSTL